jgi:hypothetical protein
LAELFLLLVKCVGMGDHLWWWLGDGSAAFSGLVHDVATALQGPNLGHRVKPKLVEVSRGA